MTSSDAAHDGVEAVLAAASPDPPLLGHDPPPAATELLTNHALTADPNSAGASAPSRLGASTVSANDFRLVAAADEQGIGISSSATAQREPPPEPNLSSPAAAPAPAAAAAAVSAAATAATMAATTEAITTATGDPDAMDEDAMAFDYNLRIVPDATASGAPLAAHAMMMLDFAQLSHQIGHPPPLHPSTVTPAQMTLGANALLPGEHAQLGGSHQAADPALESFARIEFQDSVFQMTTYAVIIGRDQRAMKQANRDERRLIAHHKKAEENFALGLPPPSPIYADRSRFSKSYVSEEGGMLGPESDGDDEVGAARRPAKRRKTSTGSSQQPDAEEVAQQQQQLEENLISDRQYVSHTPGAAAVDLNSLRPSPYHVPFIGIHSPGPNIASKTKAISREHLKIEFSQAMGVFEAIPLHKNGFFCQDTHYKEGRVVLRSGDRLQIKDVDFVFVINGVAEGHTGAEEPERQYSEGGKEMSFEFESSHGNGDVLDTSDDLSEPPPSHPSCSEDEEGNDIGRADGDSGAERTKAEPEPDPLPIVMPPKKRGPGRPPKNGIMSKREQRLLKKQQQEMAKKSLPPPPPGEPPIKRKVGRPRKHPLPEDVPESERPPKRKYKPRAPKEEGVEGSEAERRAKEKKEKKVRQKTPPLELNKDDYTEEQLQKPNKNYGVLIDEALTTAGGDGLTLKQIYKRIAQKYPYFHFVAETKGWESSVRHNLIGNEAFKKDESTGLWRRMPGVELDAGKKRKATSPDRAVGAQGYAYAPQMYPPYSAAPYQHGMPPHGYPPQHPPYPAQPGQPAAPAAPSRPGQPSHYSPAPGATGTTPTQGVGSQPPAPAQLPGYGAGQQARPPLAGPSASSYSSPYASRPPSTANATNATAGGAPVPTAVPPHPVAPAPVSAPSHPAGTPLSATHQPQQQPLAASTVRPSHTPPAGTPTPKYAIHPNLLARIVSLKDEIIKKMRSPTNTKLEGTIMSALQRVIGLKPPLSGPSATPGGGTDQRPSLEETICGAFKQFLAKCLEQNPDSFPQSAVQTNQATKVMDEELLKALNEYKVRIVGALKSKIPEEKANELFLSAASRVLGLAEASSVGEAYNAAENNIITAVRRLVT